MKIALWINEMLLALIALIAMTPLVYNNVSPFVPLGLSLIWFFFAFRTGGNHRTIFNQYTKFWFIYYGWQILCFCIGHSSESINNGVVRFCVFVIPFLVPYVLTSYVRRGHSFLFIVIGTVILVNAVSNIIIGINNPMAFAELGVWEPEEIDRSSNKGSTDMVCYCVFFIPICYLLFKYATKKTFKLICLVEILIIGYLVTVVNSRATALIILILMMFFLLLVGKGVVFKRRQILLILLFFTIILILLAQTSFGQFIVDLAADSKKLSGRFQDILIVLQGGGLGKTENGSLAARLMLSSVSLSTFFGSIINFIFGVGEDISGKDMYDLIKSGVGQHSELFDLAARYGIIGIYMVYKALSRTFKFILLLTSDKMLKNEIKVIFTFFVVYSFLNNSFFVYSFIVLFILLPIAVLYIEKSLKNNTYVI